MHSYGMHLPVYVVLGLSFALNISGGFYSFDFSFSPGNSFPCLLSEFPPAFFKFCSRQEQPTTLLFCFQKFYFYGYSFSVFLSNENENKNLFLFHSCFFFLRGVHSFRRGVFLSSDFVIYVRTCFLSAESILKHGKSLCLLSFCPFQFFFILYNSFWWMAGSTQEALVT